MFSKKRFFLERWKYLREFKEKRMTNAKKLIETRQRAKEFYCLITSRIALKKYRANMIANKKERIHKLVGRIISRKVQFAYMNFCMRKGEKLYWRIAATAKYAFNSQITTHNYIIENRARKVIHEFLSDQKTRIIFKLK